MLIKKMLVLTQSKVRLYCKVLKKWVIPSNIYHQIFICKLFKNKTKKYTCSIRETGDNCNTSMMHDGSFNLGGSI